MSVKARLLGWWRAFVAPVGRWPRWLLTCAFAMIVVMFATNDDMGGDGMTPRGDGVYRPVLGRGDGHMMYLMARSTALDFDWNFDNDLGRFGDPWSQPRGPSGHKVIPHPIGPPLVWTPLIWIAEGAAVIANVFGGEIPLHGYTLWHQRFVFLSSALFACGAVLLGLSVTRRLITGAWSPTYGAICVLLGTSLTYYATYMPGYGHAMDAFACAAFLAYWALTLGRTDLRRRIVLGIVLGVAMLIRMQELAMGVVVALEIAVAMVQTLRARERPSWWAARQLLGGATVLLVAAIVFIPQLIYWRVVYGSFFAVPQGSMYTRFGSPMILELLYSARNGWFSTTPIAYAGVIGLFCLPKSARLVAVGLILIVAIQVYLNSTIMDWWGMAAFGQRRLCSVTLPLVVGLAALLWRMGRLVARFRRIPVVVWHVVAVLAFGGLVRWNYMRVRELRAGKAATADLVPTCCGEVPGWLRPSAAWIYSRIGNPFEFPANAIFAIRHHVELWRWDITVGNYPLFPPANSLVDGTLWDQRGSWHLGHPGSEPYLLGDWSQSLKADRPFRWTLERDVTALVPNVMPYPQRLTVWLAPGGARTATLRWDGDIVATPQLAAGWNAVRFEVDAMSVGEHELVIEADVGPVADQPGWPSWKQPAGVAVGSVDVEFVRPH